MAGIGFNLKKILEGDSFIDLVKAGFYSALITAGPWLISTASILAITVLAPSNMDAFDLVFFRTAATYVYAFSLIAMGVLHLSVTRYLADKLFAKEKQSLVPTYNASALIILAIQSVVGLVIFNSTDRGFAVEFWVYVTYLAVSMMWLAMIFLTTLRDYIAVTLSFVAGAVTTVVLSLFLAKPFGLAGDLAAFAIGHLVIMALLASRFYIEFQSHLVFEPGLMIFLPKNKSLVMLGVLYNIAIWIDKIVFWMSPKAMYVSRLFHIYPSYDTAAFLAFLTIIPALAIFLLVVETDFYLHYRDFYLEILDQNPYRAIEQKRHEIADSLKRGMRVLIQYQGSFTLMIIAFAPDIIRLIGIKGVDIPLFRVVTFAAFLHILFLMIFIIILYFDFKQLALFVTAVFLVTNGVLTYITCRMDIPAFFGYGYLISAFISLVVAFYMLDYRIKRLEFYTFAPQPIGTHREKEIS